MKTFWKRLPLAAKFTVSLISVSVVLVIVAVIISNNLRREQLRDELETEASLLLIAIARSADNDLLNLDTFSLTALASELTQNSDEIETVTFFDTTGRIVATSDDSVNIFNLEPTALGQQALSSEQTFIWQNSGLQAAVPIRIERNLVGAASITLSSARIDAQIVNARFRTLIIAIFGLILVSAVSYLVSRTVVTPLRQLSEASRHIAAGDYSYPIRVDAGSEVGQLAEAFAEMTDAIAQRTRELQRATREAREASRLKDEFLAVMSHELRTPLNAIIGFQGIMKMRGNLDEKSLHQVNRTRANAERLLSIINDILDISRIESGRLQLTPVPLALHDLVESWRGQMSILADEKHLDFTVEMDDTLPETILIDEDAITKVVTNLLSNAFKFTEKGRVILRLGQQNDMLEIAVEDTGIGIPLHMQDVIFERFRQVDGSSKRQFGGSGLGLAIVQNLCREMGGQVSVRSTPDVGSTFTVTLPLKIAEFAGAS